MFYMFALWESDMTDTFLISWLNYPTEPAFIQGQIVSNMTLSQKTLQIF